MLTRTLKTAAMAAALVVATAGTSMAATYAWVNYDANVYKNHYSYSVVVNDVEEGQKVKVIGQWNNWFKLQIPGPDGWVKYKVLDFGYDDDDYNPGPGFGSSFCVQGKNAQFCLGAQY